MLATDIGLYSIDLVGPILLDRVDEGIQYQADFCSQCGTFAPFADCDGSGGTGQPGSRERGRTESCPGGFFYALGCSALWRDIVRIVGTLRMEKSSIAPLRIRFLAIRSPLIIWPPALFQDIDCKAPELSAV
jgi:hypothetical protein